jgi:hypothetical protein
VTTFGRFQQQRRSYFVSGGTARWTGYSYDALNVQRNGGVQAHPLIGATSMSSRDIISVHRAVMRHSLHEVVEALSRGEAVDALDEGRRTPLFYAAKDGDAEIVNQLIRHGANPNVPDKSLETPLHFAAREYQLEAAQCLIESGANPNAQDNHGNTPLWRAVFESRGRGDMIKLLLSQARTNL